MSDLAGPVDGCGVSAGPVDVGQRSGDVRGFGLESGAGPASEFRLSGGLERMAGLSERSGGLERMGGLFEWCIGDAGPACRGACIAACDLGDWGPDLVCGAGPAGQFVWMERVSCGPSWVSGGARVCSGAGPAGQFDPSSLVWFVVGIAVWLLGILASISASSA